MNNNELNKIINFCYTNKVIVEYSISNDDHFSVGYILSYNDEYIVTLNISSHGCFDGYTICFINNLKYINYNTKYLKRLELLIEKDNILNNNNFILTNNIMLDFLKFINNHITYIWLKDSDEYSYCGFINSFNEEGVKIDLIDDFGKIIDYDEFMFNEIMCISFLTEESRCDEIISASNMENEDIYCENKLYTIYLKDGFSFDAFILSKDDKSIIFFEIYTYGEFNGFRYELLDSIEKIEVNEDSYDLKIMNCLLKNKKTYYKNPFSVINQDNNILKFMKYSNNKNIYIETKDGSYYEGYVLKKVDDKIYIKSMDEYNYYTGEIFINIDNISLMIVDSLYTKDDDYIYRIIND